MGYLRKVGWPMAKHESFSYYALDRSDQEKGSHLTVANGIPAPIGSFFSMILGVFI